MSKELSTEQRIRVMTDTRTENEVMYFDRSTYPRTAHTEGQCTLDGRVFHNGEYEVNERW